MLIRPLQLTEHFALAEFACNDGTVVPDKYLYNAWQLALNLEVLRAQLVRPVTINSGYRTAAYNASVGGVASSQHLTCRAADIVVPSVPPEVVADTIEALISRGLMHNGGIGRYSTFTHYDVRPLPARWKG